jgi:hypothetical protein
MACLSKGRVVGNESWLSSPMQANTASRRPNAPYKRHPRRRGIICKRCLFRVPYFRRSGSKTLSILTMAMKLAI